MRPAASRADSDNGHPTTGDLQPPGGGWLEIRGARHNNRQNVDVIVLGRTGKGRKGIDVHRATGLEPRDITTVDGIPCTAVARTLLDLATTIDQTALERAVEQAEKLRIFDLAAVVDVTTRACDRRAATNLQKALAAYTPEPAFTRSELEKRFLALCRAAGIPRPRTNNVTKADEVDFTWPDRQVHDTPADVAATLRALLAT